MPDQARTEFNVIHPQMGIGALSRDVLRDDPDGVIQQGIMAETMIVELQNTVRSLRAQTRLTGEDA